MNEEWSKKGRKNENKKRKEDGYIRKENKKWIKKGKKQHKYTTHIDKERKIKEKTETKKETCKYTCTTQICPCRFLFAGIKFSCCSTNLSKFRNCAECQAKISIWQHPDHCVQNSLWRTACGGQPQPMSGARCHVVAPRSWTTRSTNSVPFTATWFWELQRQRNEWNWKQSQIFVSCVALLHGHRCGERVVADCLTSAFWGRMAEVLYYYSHVETASFQLLRNESDTEKAAEIVHHEGHLGLETMQLAAAAICKFYDGQGMGKHGQAWACCNPLIVPRENVEIPWIRLMVWMWIGEVAGISWTSDGTGILCLLPGETETCANVSFTKGDWELLISEVVLLAGAELSQGDSIR